MTKQIDLDLGNLDKVFPENFTQEQVAKAKTLFLKKLAEEAHKFYGGKIQTVPKAPVLGFNWFNVWYTPGVSKISTNIRDNNDVSYDLSNRGNLVAVVSDSTRVLGDGNVTPSGGLGVMEGKAFLIRFADDAVLLFSHESDARRVMEVLPKRFGKYGLALHPEKTRLLDFLHPARREAPSEPRGGSGGRSFEFLGFTHFWGKSRKGLWIIKRKTSSNRLSRSLKRVKQLCRLNRHWKVKEQHVLLCSRLQGHYAYFGITGNADALGHFYREVRRIWRKWLDRRSNSRYVSWERFVRIVQRYPLPTPRVVHSIYRQCAASP